MAQLATDYTGVREYIGARYVPIFADPVEWNQNLAYEPLTIVTYAGNSYTSRQYVPKGVLINNTEYWVPTGNFNGQLELYRKEVADLSDDLNTEIQNRKNADDAIHSVLDKLGVAVTKVDFVNTNSADQWGIKFTFSDGKQRLLYCGDDFIRYFDSVEQKQLWTIDAFHRTYDVFSDFRINYRNNIAIVNCTGYIFNWVKTESNEWIRIATAAQMGLTFPPIDPTSGASHYYGVLNVNYEEGIDRATIRIGADGAWCRMSGSQSGQYLLYGQCAMTATAQRASTMAMPLSDDWEVNVMDDMVILVDLP